MSSDKTDPKYQRPDTFAYQFDEKAFKSEQDADLNYVLDEIVACDDKHCPWIDELFPDAVMLLMAVRFPEIVRDLSRCEVAKKPQHECTSLFMEGLNRTNPILQDLLERRRGKKDDPLQGYDPMLYQEPFWFQGVGNIWRRIEHGSKKVTVKNCHYLRREVDQCFKDGKLPGYICERKRGEAQACEAGCYCPYLRYKIFKCLYAPTPEYQTEENDKNPSYPEIRGCLEALPNFKPCQRGYVPEVADQV